ncbi:MAG: DUF2812 domain-containing protein [Ruminococcaceae bacterium]|nr:DUF2812 domain-containing protein [Oscillospiraceae bacterium]
MKEQKVIYPHNPATVHRVEQWLADQAAAGYMLTKHKRWSFYFEKAEPKQTQYYMYMAVQKNDRNRKEFFDLKNKYALSKSKSDFNKNDTSLRIFEADPAKTDASFYAARQFRKQVYVAHYVKMCLVLLLLLIGFCCLVPYVPEVIVGIVLSALIFIYHVVSLLILVRSQNEK